MGSFSRNWANLGRCVCGAGFASLLVLTNPVHAAFTDEIAEGADNTQFYYLAYEDGALAPILVQGQGVAGDDAVRFGGFGSTGNTSREHGFYFDVSGPGTLSFQWAVSTEGFSAGTGAYLYYQTAGDTSINPQFITGEQSLTPVEIQLNAGTTTVYLFYVRSAVSTAGGQDAAWVDQLVWTPAGGGSDTTPDAFSFTAQTDAALSSMATSNGVTVSGIDAAADISIASCTGSSCQYNVNNGAWTSTAGTVSSGDVVRVRQISSASNSTTTSLTLDIGGISDSFDVTTLAAPPAPVPVVEGPTATGSGIARAFVEPSDSGAGCTVSDAQFISTPEPPPQGVTLPHGLFSFTSSGCTGGFSVEVTVEYPGEIPADSAYWKYDADAGWFTIPAAIVGNTVTFTLVDNGTGDLNPDVGTISDPGGIGLGSTSGTGSGAQAIPTLPQWAMVILVGALTFFALVAGRRRRAF